MLRKYYDEYTQYEIETKQGKRVKKPQRPPFIRLFVPGNSSTPVIYSHLRDCTGTGVIFEVETEALDYLLHKDREGFFHIASNNFHHETISIARTNNSKAIFIPKPRLSILLAGNDSQIEKVIKSYDNQLFSRFLFYWYDASYVWHDVSPQNAKVNLLNLIPQLGVEVKTMLTELNNTPITFNLTEEQWLRLNEHYADKLGTLSCISEGINATVKRMGLITFRIAMLLQVLSDYENGMTENVSTCSDACFKTAMEMSRVYLRHAQSLYEQHSDEGPKLEVSLKNLLKALPDKFDRKTALQIAADNKIIVSDRTIDKYLKRLLEHGYLGKGEYNRYSKVIPLQTADNEKAA
jgi:hypothetical protein